MAYKNEVKKSRNEEHVTRICDLYAVNIIYKINVSLIGQLMYLSVYIYAQLGKDTLIVDFNENFYFCIIYCVKIIMSNLLSQAE